MEFKIFWSLGAGIKSTGVICIELGIKKGGWYLLLHIDATSRLRRTGYRLIPLLSPPSDQRETEMNQQSGCLPKQQTRLKRFDKKVRGNPIMLLPNISKRSTETR